MYKGRDEKCFERELKDKMKIPSKFVKPRERKWQYKDTTLYGT